MFNSRKNDNILKDGKEPYPISLRGINWIKFLSKHNISDQAIDTALYSEYLVLMDNLEYHLLGNHLLENGFSLYVGGCYFKDEKLIITPFDRKPRQGWDDSFKDMNRKGDDALVVNEEMDIYDGDWEW